MSEVNGNGGATQTPVNSYVEAISEALGVKEISAICRECARAEGWPDWTLLPMPVVMQSVALPGELPMTTLAASLTCKRCGYMRLYRLDFLGVKMEQQRIITP